ncbi:hypothetical protein GBAR_LOCUS10660 [Geodia barretti]|uniref:Uncharacterized protein n=1 Tax=Geodia barretti TaxID=519541 RepID=A0AA35RVD4_GEOBA|nr:hypothetical protein GBAR_LOCUS10660 [Geodia barretti]
MRRWGRVWEEQGWPSTGASASVCSLAMTTESVSTERVGLVPLQRR